MSDLIHQVIFDLPPEPQRLAFRALRWFYSIMQTTASAVLKTTFGALALAASMGAAFARPGVITREAFACTSWAGAYAYTRASLTRQGAKANKNCPIRLSAGTKVEIIATDEDGDGYVEVSVNGRKWWIDDERVK